LFGENIVGSSSDKTRHKSPKMLAGERVKLRQYVSVAETLHIMAEPDQTLYPHSRLSTNRPYLLIFKIRYDKYPFCFFHNLSF
jgi:hypothetical protein